MGYDLHITRKDFWADEEDEKSISRSEWLAYVETDPEITDDPDNPFEDCHLYHRAAENWPLWFDPRLGNIDTKNPPPEVIEKMVRIAQSLGAKVRGDDDELYYLNGDELAIQQQPMTLANTAHNEEIPSTETKSTDSYERYIWYFCAVVLITSLIWHSFFPSK